MQAGGATVIGLATEADLSGTGLAPDPLAELARRVADGDPRATRALLEALAPRILGAARGLLGRNDPDADDAAQEALVAVLKALPAFRGESSVSHYAMRIAVRCCMEVRRKSRRSRPPEALAHEDAQERQEERATAGEPLVAARRRREVRELLDTLPEAQAETLALRVVLGLSMQEVATATGAPVNTVRSRLRLAKEALRRRIESDPELAELLEVES